MRGIRIGAVAPRFMAGFIGLSIVMVLVLAALLFGEFDQALGDLRDARGQMVIDGIKANVEGELAVGVLLPSVVATQDVIERAQTQHPDIISIDVFDNTGKLFFTTDRGGAGDQVSVRQFAECLDGTPSRFRDNDQLVLCSPLRSTFRTVLGGVALRYPPTDIGTVLTQLYRETKLGGLLVLPSFALLGLIGCLVGLSDLHLLIRRLTGVMRGDAQPIDPSDRLALSQRVEAAAVQFAAVEAELTALEQRAMALDALEPGA